MAKEMIPGISVESRILEIRKQKVMLDRDLALLYGIETKRLNEQVKRNLERFPDDFMFQLSKDEFENWTSQFATSNSEKMSIRRAPYAFTPNGIAMLSSVLNSRQAIQVNIQIMRTFTKLREVIQSHQEIKRKFDSIDRKFTKSDEQFKIIFDFIKNLMNPKTKSKKKIGFD